jgi:hypothetical protein
VPSAYYGAGLWAGEGARFAPPCRARLLRLTLIFDSSLTQRANVTELSLPVLTQHPRVRRCKRFVNSLAYEENVVANAPRSYASWQLTEAFGGRRRHKSAACGQVASCHTELPQLQSCYSVSYRTVDSRRSVTLATECTDDQADNVVGTQFWSAARSIDGLLGP